MRKRSIKSAFYDHKKGAARGHIPFLLTFEEWLKIWVDSGHMHERGCRKGEYVMARFGDKGPYAIGNVKIITCNENCSDANRGRKRSDETCQKISAVRKGKPTRTGAVLSSKTKRKISKTKKGNSPRLIGELNGMWGKSHTKEARLKMRIARAKQLGKEPPTCL